ncbi:MAG: alkaline shock response membrane anchor protein AmaP [Dehalococcoidia bacterium]
MNALRRIYLVVYSVLLLAAVGGITALAWNQDEQLDLNVSDLNIKAFVEASDGAKYALTGILGGIALIAIISLLVAVWPSRQRSAGALRIVQTDGGTVEVTSTAIESLLKDELESLSEVQSATPRVKLSGGAVDTYLDVQIEPSASIAHATKLLSARVEETLREQVGVTSIRRPVIRISYDELAARPVGVRRSRPAMPANEMRPQHASQPEAAVQVTDRPIYPDDPDRPPEAPKFVSPADEDPSNV